jgi:hypothetical protein
MIKIFQDPAISLIFAGISMASIGSAISMVAGVLGIIYTGMRIYDWIEARK